MSILIFNSMEKSENFSVKSGAMVTPMCSTLCCSESSGSSLLLTSLTTSKLPDVSVDFPSLAQEVEMCRLLAMFRNCPNINIKKLSICNSTSSWRFCEQETLNIVKFFKSVNLVNLQNIEISCTDTVHLDNEFFIALKQHQNVTFKKVNFKYDPRTKNIEFINIFYQNLEEINGLSLLLVTPHFKNCLPNLTTLDIRCSALQLLTTLTCCPNLQNLSWFQSLWKEEEDWEAIQDYDHTESLTKLRKLFIGIRFNESLDIVNRLAPHCLNVKSLKCQVMNGGGITWIYKYFPKLEELHLFQRGGLSFENIVGLPTSSLALHHKLKDPIVRGKLSQPYIGSFANLRVLNFGLRDYQQFAAGWNWQIKLAAFKYGICHLSRLNQIIFPPINMESAENILSLLASKMKQIRLVQFQIWLDTNTTRLEGEHLGLQVQPRLGIWELDQAMKRSHIEQLKSQYVDKFQVQAIVIKEQDDINYSIEFR